MNTQKANEPASFLIILKGKEETKRVIRVHLTVTKATTVFNKIKTQQLAQLSNTMNPPHNSHGNTRESFKSDERIRKELSCNMSLCAEEQGMEIYIIFLYMK